MLVYFKDLRQIQRVTSVKTLRAIAAHNFSRKAQDPTTCFVALEILPQKILDHHKSPNGCDCPSPDSKPIKKIPKKTHKKQPDSKPVKQIPKKTHKKQKVPIKSEVCRPSRRAKEIAKRLIKLQLSL